jgi:hypothetical protein
MADWGVVGRQFERMDWIERIVWIAFALGGSTVISFGHYLIEVTPAFKFLLVATFLLILCAAFYYRLGWLARAGGTEVSQTSRVSKTTSLATHTSVSVLRIREIAENEYGWDFNTYIDQLMGLVGGIRQAAVHYKKTGIAFEGRKGCISFREEMKLNFPLQPILPEYFIDWSIELPLWSNWDVTTSRINGRDEDRFRDLFVTDEDALRCWLAGPANEYKTPQANVDVRSALIHMAFYSDIKGAPEAIAEFERAARDRDVDVYGYNIWPGMGVVSNLSKLTQGYWHHARLDVESFDIKEKWKPTDPGYEEFVERWQRTVPDDTEDAYCKLRVNREKVLQIWPAVKPGGPLGN